MKNKWKGHLLNLDCDASDFVIRNQSEIINELYDYIEELERKEKIADAVIMAFRQGYELMQDDGDWGIDGEGYVYDLKVIAKNVYDLLKWAEENK